VKEDRKVLVEELAYRIMDELKKVRRGQEKESTVRVKEKEREQKRDRPRETGRRRLTEKQREILRERQSETRQEDTGSHFSFFFIFPRTRCS
jgi:hypothetical protein